MTVFADQVCLEERPNSSILYLVILENNEITFIHPTHTATATASTTLLATSPLPRLMLLEKVWQSVVAVPA